MTSSLHLTIATPFTVLVESDQVRSLRASDASGSFGILPGHSNFLTVLPASVLEWRTNAGSWKYCAIRAGVLSVSSGESVAVACRKGVLGRDLSGLEAEVFHSTEAETDQTRRARVEQARLHAQAVRQLVRYLVPRGRSGLSSMAPSREL